MKNMLDVVVEVTDILEEMDIPQLRKDLGKFVNTRWLLRNLAINNRNHPKCAEVLGMIKRINKANRLHESQQIQGVTNG